VTWAYVSASIAGVISLAGVATARGIASISGSALDDCGLGEPLHPQLQTATANRSTNSGFKAYMERIATSLRFGALGMLKGMASERSPLSGRAP